MGHGLSPASDEAETHAALRRLVDDRDVRTGAANFGRSCNGNRPGIAIDAAAEEIDELLR